MSRGSRARRILEHSLEEAVLVRELKIPAAPGSALNPCPRYTTGSEAGYLLKQPLLHTREVCECVLWIRAAR